MAKRVFSGLVTAWRLEAWPTRRSPLSVKATIDGVVRAPSEFSITLASLPSMIATQELVVPRSIPITFAIFTSLLVAGCRDPVSGIPAQPPYGMGSLRLIRAAEAHVHGGYIRR